MTMHGLRTAALAALFVALLGGCASTPEGETVASNSDPDRLICRKEESMGSRLPKRICKKNAEWERDAEASRQAVRTQQRGAVGGAQRAEGRVN